MDSLLLFRPHRWQRGKYIGVLEEALANYLSASYAFGFSSEGAALWQTLKGWGMGVGDEVIVSACVSQAIRTAIQQAGAVSIFADVEEDTSNLDHQKLNHLMTGKTRAVVVQHAFGQAANLEKILPWARTHGVKVVEDCSHSLGARYRGELLGTFGDAALFSFGHLGSRELAGGAVTASDPHLGRALEVTRQRLSFPPRRLMARHLLGGRPPVGVYRLPNVWAMGAYRRFVGIDEWNRRRREIAGYYLQQLRGVPTLKLPRIEEGAEPSFHRFTIRVPDPDRLLRTAHRSRVVLARWSDAVSPVESCPVAKNVVNHAVLLPTAIPLARVGKVVRVIKEHYQPGADR